MQYQAVVRRLFVQRLLVQNMQSWRLHSSVSLLTAHVLLQNYDRKLDQEEALEDLRELGLEVKDSRTGNYTAPGSGGVADSARGKQGAGGYTNGFGNPASMGKPLTGQVVNV